MPRAGGRGGARRRGPGTQRLRLRRRPKRCFAALRGAGTGLGAIPFPRGSGDNLWSFVHVDDLADLFTLALDRAAGSQLFHAGAQSALRTRDIAAALSRGAGWEGRTIELPLAELRPLFPVAALADYWSQNGQSSREKAERLLGWRPRHLDMLGEIAGLRHQPLS